VHDVALGMASAEAIGVGPDLGQRTDRRLVVASGEGQQGTRERQADVARHHRVRSGSCRRTFEARDHASGRCQIAGAAERHDRMTVVERIEAVLRDRPPGIGQRLPARADVDAAERQPPEQRGRIDHLERDGRLHRSHARVVELEHAIVLTEVEMKQTLVPPVVERECVVDRPVARAGDQAVDAIAVTALHLHDVHERMYGPGIAWVQLERLEARVLGTVVEAGFLEPERVHSQHVTVARHRGVPGRQDLRDAVAQHRRLAQQEIAYVRRLQREQVTRVLDDDLAILADGIREIAFEPGPGGGRVRALAIIGAGPHCFDRTYAGLDQRRRPALGRHHTECGPQRVTRRKRWIVLQQRVDRRQRVDEIGNGELESLLVLLEGFALVARNGQATAVLHGHCGLRLSMSLRAGDQLVATPWECKVRGPREGVVSTGVNIP
jgi:hypothetical protein